MPKGWRDDVTGLVFCCPSCSIDYRNRHAAPRAAPRANPGDAARERLVEQARARREGVRENPLGVVGKAVLLGAAGVAGWTWHQRKQQEQRARAYRDSMLAVKERAVDEDNRLFQEVGQLTPISLTHAFEDIVRRVVTATYPDLPDADDAVEEVRYFFRLETGLAVAGLDPDRKARIEAQDDSYLSLKVDDLGVIEGAWSAVFSAAKALDSAPLTKQQLRVALSWTSHAFRAILADHLVMARRGLRKNPGAYNARMDWGRNDMEQVKVVATELSKTDHPFHVLAALANSLPKHIASRKSMMPHVGALMEYHPSSSKQAEFWAFSYLVNGEWLDAPERKKVESAAKRIIAACRGPVPEERALFLACAYCESNNEFFDLVKARGDSRHRDGGTARQAFVRDCQTQKDLKDQVKSEWDVDEFIIYTLQDTLRGAMQELQTDLPPF